VYVTNYGSNTVSIIDTIDNALETSLSVGTNPEGIAVSSTTAYVANYGAGTVSVIDTQANVVLSQCTPVCGNGEVGTGEECDDGNTANGDGCSASCTVEHGGWSCSGAPSVCTLDCADGAAAGATAARHYGHACYAFYDPVTDLDFSHAETACEAVHGTLAAVDSAAVQALTSGMGSYAWIGLTDADSEGTFTWVNGTPLAFTYWETGQPNGGAGENCVLKENANKWHDYPCGGLHPYFCQIPDPSSSSSSNASEAGHVSGGMRSATLRSLIHGAEQRLTGSSSSATRHAPEVRSAVGGGASSLQLRVCGRVAKYAGNARMMKKLNERLLHRFGFGC
jgi:cysteine-rich repeat protein/YVTN family beta-propeller protein